MKILQNILELSCEIHEIHFVTSKKNVWTEVEASQSVERNFLPFNKLRNAQLHQEAIASKEIYEIKRFVFTIG